MRTGPEPLSIHISLATAALAQMLPDDRGKQEEGLQKMLTGIRAYQLYPHPQKKLKTRALWQSGTVSIQGTENLQKKSGRPVMLLVPSLVNKSYILDLMESRSMLRWLNAQGIEAYLLDWGDVTGDPFQQNIEDLILERFVKAIAFLHEHTGQRITVMGYCMGGTILTGAAMHARDMLQGCIYLAAPWDFHTGAQALLNRVKFWAPSAFPLIAEKEMLPVSWTQTVFASLDPFMTLQKFSNFADMEAGSEEADLFVAVEDWLNDGNDLPGAAAQQVINDWFLQNYTAQKKWQLGGQNVDPALLKMPSLVIASDKDRLVEFETAKALYDALPGAQLLNPGCGHIGMIAGRNAVEKVWRPMAEWVLSTA